MNPATNMRHERVVMFWSVMFFIFLGACIFLNMVIATGGLLVSLITTGIAITVLGLVHYLFWGRTSGKNIAWRSDAPAYHADDHENPFDEVALALSESERVQLLHLAEHALTDNRVTITSGQAEMNGRNVERQDAVLRTLIDKLCKTHHKGTKDTKIHKGLCAGL